MIYDISKIWKKSNILQSYFLHQSNQHKFKKPISSWHKKGSIYEKWDFTISDTIIVHFIVKILNIYNMLSCTSYQGVHITYFNFVTYLKC